MSSPSRFRWLKPNRPISFPFLCNRGLTPTLHPVDGSEGKLGHNTSVKDGVEHGEERGEGKTWRRYLKRENGTELNQPIANIDFIFTMVRSLLVFFSFSSSCSIFLFLLLSRLEVSPWASFFFSSFLVCFSISVLSFWYFSVLYTRTQVTPWSAHVYHLKLILSCLFSPLPTEPCTRRWRESGWCRPTSLFPGASEIGNHLFSPPTMKFILRIIIHVMTMLEPQAAARSNFTEISTSVLAASYSITATLIHCIIMTRVCSQIMSKAENCWNFSSSRFNEILRSCQYKTEKGWE